MLSMSVHFLLTAGYGVWMDEVGVQGPCQVNSCLTTGGVIGRVGGT